MSLLGIHYYKNLEKLILKVFKINCLASFELLVEQLHHMHVG